MGDVKKRKKSLIILSVVIIAIIVISSIVGCSINGFKQDDFQLEITSIRIDGNKVTVTAQLKNKSLRNGLVTSNGLIEIYYTDENGMPDNWASSSICIYDWIRCKQKITATYTFELEKGTYTITATAGFSCNNEKDDFVYKAVKTIEV